MSLDSAAASTGAAGPGAAAAAPRAAGAAGALPAAAAASFSTRLLEQLYQVLDRCDVPYTREDLAPAQHSDNHLLTKEALALDELDVRLQHEGKGRVMVSSASDGRSALLALSMCLHATPSELELVVAELHRFMADRGEHWAPAEPPAPDAAEAQPPYQQLWQLAAAVYGRPLHVYFVPERSPVLLQQFLPPADSDLPRDAAVSAADPATDAAAAHAAPGEVRDAPKPIIVAILPSGRVDAVVDGGCDVGLDRCLNLTDAEAAQQLLAAIAGARKQMAAMESTIRLLRSKLGQRGIALEAQRLWLDPVEHELQQLRNSMSMELRRRRIGLYGDSGEGKSVLANALLGVELLPSSSMGTGTTMVTSVAWAPHDGYQVFARLMTADDLHAMIQEYSSLLGSREEGDARLRAQLEQRLLALFPGRASDLKHVVSASNARQPGAAAAARELERPAVRRAAARLQELERFLGRECRWQAVRVARAPAEAAAAGDEGPQLVAGMLPLPHAFNALSWFSTWADLPEPMSVAGARVTLQLLSHAGRAGAPAIDADPEELASLPVELPGLQQLPAGVAAWAMVQEARVTSRELLSPGLELVDLPGPNDMNAAMEQVARSGLQNCAYVLHIARAQRATDEVLQQLRTLRKQGLLGRTVSVVTKADALITKELLGARETRSLCASVKAAVEDEEDVKPALRRAVLERNRMGSAMLRGTVRAAVAADPDVRLGDSPAAEEASSGHGAAAAGAAAPDPSAGSVAAGQGGGIGANATAQLREWECWGPSFVVGALGYDEQIQALRRARDERRAERALRKLQAEHMNGMVQLVRWLALVNGEAEQRTFDAVDALRDLTERLRGLLEREQAPGYQEPSSRPSRRRVQLSAEDVRRVATAFCSRQLPAAAAAAAAQPADPPFFRDCSHRLVATAAPALAAVAHIGHHSTLAASLRRGGIDIVQHAVTECMPEVWATFDQLATPALALAQSLHGAAVALRTRAGQAASRDALCQCVSELCGAEIAPSADAAAQQGVNWEAAAAAFANAAQHLQQVLQDTRNAIPQIMFQASLNSLNRALSYSHSLWGNKPEWSSRFGGYTIGVRQTMREAAPSMVGAMMDCLSNTRRSLNASASSIIAEARRAWANVAVTALRGAISAPGEAEQLGRLWDELGLHREASVAVLDACLEPAAGVADGLGEGGDEPDEALCDPVLYTLMAYPVTMRDNEQLAPLDYRSMLEVLRSTGRHPLTRARLTADDLVPARQAYVAICEWVRAHPAFTLTEEGQAFRMRVLLGCPLYADAAVTELILALDAAASEAHLDW